MVPCQATTAVCLCLAMHDADHDTDLLTWLQTHLIMPDAFGRHWPVGRPCQASLFWAFLRLCVTEPLGGDHWPCLLLLQPSAPCLPFLAEQPTLSLPPRHLVKSYCGIPTFCPKWVTTSQTVVLHITLVCSFQNSKNWRGWDSIRCCFWGTERCLLFLGF